MFCLQGALVTALLLMVPAFAQARELASAPEISAIGFSRDGRLFAYEQFLDDDVSAAVMAAIDVVTRDGAGSAKGFPFGFLGVQKNGEFPLRVGGHKIKLSDDDNISGAKKLAALRATIRKQTATRLKTLGIVEPGRRLAGRTITDRTESTTPIEFVLGATLPGPVPDTQALYRVSARFAPDDQESCVNDQKSVDHTITLEIAELDPRDKAVQGTRKTELAWPAGEHECASGLRITDVIEPPTPANRDEPRFVVVVVLATSWAPHAESARYFAGFVRLP
jgi:predicted secreted protein